MSKLVEFRAAEKALAEQLAHLESLKNDAALKAEIEFETKIKELMAAYGKSLRDIVSILDPETVREAGVRGARISQSTRRARAVKVYRNPHTSEMVETKGSNHKVLKAWKAEYGNDVVESWLQS
jgi:hypothetical protein